MISMLPWIISVIISLFISSLVSGLQLKPCVGWSGLHVNCSLRSLGSIPENASASATHLDLHGNLIDHLPNRTDELNSWDNITFLDLSSNNLSSITSQWLQGLTSLKVLNVSSNRLSSLPFDQMCSVKDLTSINLADNLITYDNDNDENNVELYNCTLSNLIYLDLSINFLSLLPKHFLQGLTGIQHLNVSWNLLSEIPANIGQVLVNLETLDLSHNKLRLLETNSFSNLHNLTRLYLNSNQLHFVLPEHFSDLWQLRILSLANNPLTRLDAFLFYQSNKLQQLDISNLTQLTKVHSLTFTGMHALRLLNLSGCSTLAFLHATTFANLTLLQKLDLRNNALESLYEPMLPNSIMEVFLEGNPWKCDCELEWLYRAIIFNSNKTLNISGDQNIVCNSPAHLHGMQLNTLDASEFECSAALIVNLTEKALVPFGSATVLNCLVSGCPHPSITWVTPRNKVFHLNPKSSPASGKEQPASNQFGSRIQNRQLDQSMQDRIYILENGSLLIKYVLRTDAGNYTCFIENSLGNDTTLIEFKLDYQSFRQNIVFSVLVGYSSAGCFFLITTLLAIIRYFSHKCSREQRQKRKSIYSILESLENYRCASLDKFRDYKSAKMDQLSAYKSAKVDKLRNYKNLYYTTVVSYMEKMRENYSHSVNRIKENCRQQMENVRDNYVSQKGKFKDYRSHQIDKLQENYNNQVIKIRDYGATQVAKLRDQYKLQQQHIMKILEILDVGSCMTVIEAECMRTESAIFDDLDFDLVTPNAKGFLQHSLSDSDCKESESSDMYSLQNAPFPEVLSAADMHFYETERARNKRFRHHRRQPSNMSTDTSNSQDMPEMFPVTAEVIPCSDLSMQDEAHTAQHSGSSAYATALSESSCTEYESARSQNGRFKQNTGEVASTSSRSSTPTIKADVVIAIDAEDGKSCSSLGVHETTV